MRLVWRASPTVAHARDRVDRHHRGHPHQLQPRHAGESVGPSLVPPIIAGIVGAPIFTLLGGFALFASLTGGSPRPLLPLIVSGADDPTVSRQFRCSRLPGFCWRRASVVRAVLRASSAPGLVGSPAAPQSRPQRCAHSSRCSRASGDDSRAGRSVSCRAYAIVVSGAILDRFAHGIRLARLFPLRR